MEVLLLVLHVVAAIAIIGLVLIQHGKGADVGAAFGSGSSGSVFGARGSANFMSRLTGILAAVFFLTSMGLTYVSTKKPSAGAGVMSSQPALGGKAGDKPLLPGQLPSSGAVPAGKSDATAPNSEAPAAKAGTAGTPSEADSKAKEVPK